MSWSLQRLQHRPRVERYELAIVSMSATLEIVMSGFHTLMAGTCRGSG